jgi:hypothetical protein
LVQDPALLLADGVVDLGQGDPLEAVTQAVIADQETDGAALGAQQREIDGVLAQLDAALAVGQSGWVGGASGLG